MSDIGAAPSEEFMESVDPTVEENMEAQEQALELSDLLNLLRESILDHELRLMSIEEFLSKLIEQIKSEVEGSGDSESPEHPA